MQDVEPPEVTGEPLLPVAARRRLARIAAGLLFVAVLAVELLGDPVALAAARRLCGL